ncbi:hypothetical protein KAT92_06365 [Candidatus Babeliales bacterium]|nr:hypothetical protein [Candidatus Babeliales bacterium]
METKPEPETKSEKTKPANELYTEMGISEERAMFIMKYVGSMTIEATNPEGFYTSDIIQAIQEEPEFDIDEKVFATFILGRISAIPEVSDMLKTLQISQSPFGVLLMPQPSSPGNSLVEFLKSMSDVMPDELPDDLDCENCDRTDCAHHPTHDPTNKRYEP